MLLNVGSGGGAAAAPTSGAAAGGAADAPTEETKKEEKEEGECPGSGSNLFHTDQPAAKEESDEDMGFGLFD